MKENYRILYENAIKASELQDNNKRDIDNKINNLMTVELILLGIIIEFIKIGNLFPENGFELTTIFDSMYIIFVVIIVLLYLACITLNLITIVRCLITLKGKEYEVIDPKSFTYEENKNMDDEEIYNELIEGYAKIAENNSITNKKSMKTYDICTVLLIIEVFIMVVLYLETKFIGIGIIK